MIFLSLASKYLFEYFTLLQIIKDRAQTKLKTAADKHWSDGALEVPASSSTSVTSFILYTMNATLKV